MSDDLHIRLLTGFDELEECVRLQKVTWGDELNELVPPAILMVTQKLGGIVAGCFDDAGEMVGFVYGLTGIRYGKPVHWSHMLAVLPSMRDRGVGARLKQYQREQVIKMGIETMLWTYDPLVARNAHLNLNRLGARVAEYVVDLYGESIGGANAAVSTDRFILEWHLAQGNNGSGEPSDPGPVLTFTPDSAETELRRDAIIQIEIPADIEGMRERGESGEEAWRASTRRAFLHYLAADYDVLGIRSSGDRRFYVLQG